MLMFSSSCARSYPSDCQEHTVEGRGRLCMLSKNLEQDLTLSRCARNARWVDEVQSALSP